MLWSYASIDSAVLGQATDHPRVADTRAPIYHAAPYCEADVLRSVMFNNCADSNGAACSLLNFAQAIRKASPTLSAVCTYSCFDWAILNYS